MPSTSGVYISTSAPLTVSPAWTAAEQDGHRVAHIEIQRGRKDELDRTGTGTCTVTLNHYARRNGSLDETWFDKGHVKVDLWNPVLETWTTVYRGYRDNIQRVVHPKRDVTYLEMSCVDAFDYLAGFELAPSTGGHPADRPQDVDTNVWYEPALVDDRILAALGDADWPVGLSEIFSGNVALWDSVYPPRTPVLEVIQDAAESEFPGVANVYVSKAGVVTFHGRRARFFPDVAEYNINEWWLGDATAIGAIWAPEEGNVAQIRSFAYERNRSRLINAALATPQDIDDDEYDNQIVTDATSITANGLHSWSAENLQTAAHALDGTATPATALAETKKFATYYVNNYKNIQSRVTQITVQSLPPSDPRAAYTWRVLTEIEISDLIHVYVTFSNTSIIEDYFVEGISYDISPLNPEFDMVTMTLDLSPAAYYTNNPFDDEGPS